MYWDVNAPPVLYFPSPGLAGIRCERLRRFPSQRALRKPTDEQCAGMYPGNTPAGLGEEETDPCAALDGAACTQSETAAQSSRVFPISHCSSQKFPNQTPVFQRLNSTFSLTLEKNERHGRAHPDGLSSSQRWLLPTLLSMSASSFALSEG